MDKPNGQWLVRQTKNLISGPFSTAQIKEMLLNGSLCRQDEVCQSGSYWFYLYEQAEVSGQLGLDSPKKSRPFGEVEEITTETQIQTDVLKLKIADVREATKDTKSAVPDTQGANTPFSTTTPSLPKEMFPPEKSRKKLKAETSIFAWIFVSALLVAALFLIYRLLDLLNK